MSKNKHKCTAYAYCLAHFKDAFLISLIDDLTIVLGGLDLAPILIGCHSFWIQYKDDFTF